LAPEKPKKTSVSGYRLTDEDRARATERRRELAQKRREEKERAKLGLEATIAFELEKRADEIVQAYLTAGLEHGEWRALDSLVDRHLGRAITRVETKSLNVTASLSELSQEQLQALAAHAPRPELPPAA
jgi:hypothetical protein